MYYSLTGILIHSDSDGIAIDCGGVAYYCRSTLATLANLGGQGSEATVYTYLSVRENALELYGFGTQAELATFKLLISVTGIGPKIALGVLSHLTPDQIALSIAADDYKSLTAAPGVGKKTAQRMVLELKDKITDTDLAAGVARGAGGIALSGGNLREAIGALVVLGYSQTQAATALRNESPDESVQDLIKKALRVLADKG